MGGRAAPVPLGRGVLSLQLTDPAELGLDPQRLARLGQFGATMVAQGRLSCALTLVARHGKLAHLSCHGMADIERGVALRPDSVFRIYSMTKPLTSLAILMLYEEGHFLLDDPITTFLPEFANMRVHVAGGAQRPTTVPALRDITFRDLLTHTAGFTYAFMDQHPVDAMYRATGLDSSGASIQDMMARLACLPLLAQPGTAWNYSVATDVLGHLVSVVSGQSFDAFLQQRILGPLGMTDTSFVVRPDQLDRFTSVYTNPPKSSLRVIDDAQASAFATPGRICSGGGGLVGTAADYLRFCQLMLGRGAVDGVRLLGRKTIELMTADHVGEAVMSAGLGRLSGTRPEGRGFGLGFAVMLNPARAQMLGSAGEYAWSGMANTHFLIDPSEDLAMVFMTQFIGLGMEKLSQQLRVLTYQSIVA